MMSLPIFAILVSCLFGVESATTISPVNLRELKEMSMNNEIIPSNFTALDKPSETGLLSSPTYLRIADELSYLIIPKVLTSIVNIVGNVFKLTDETKVFLDTTIDTLIPPMIREGLDILANYVLQFLARILSIYVKLIDPDYILDHLISFQKMVNPFAISRLLDEIIAIFNLEVVFEHYLSVSKNLLVVKLMHYCKEYLDAIRLRQFIGELVERDESGRFKVMMHRLHDPESIDQVKQKLGQLFDVVQQQLKNEARRIERGPITSIVFDYYNEGFSAKDKYLDMYSQFFG